MGVSRVATQGVDIGSFFDLSMTSFMLYLEALLPIISPEMKLYSSTDFKSKKKTPLHSWIMQSFPVLVSTKDRMSRWHNN